MVVCDSLRISIHGVIINSVGPDDYIFDPTTLTFGPQSGLRLCADIELVDDDIPDGRVETFMYQFSTLTDRVILPLGGNISIVDNEREL